MSEASSPLQIKISRIYQTSTWRSSRFVAEKRQNGPKKERKNNFSLSAKGSHKSRMKSESKNGNKLLNKLFENSYKQSTECGAGTDSEYWTGKISTRKTFPFILSPLLLSPLLSLSRLVFSWINILVFKESTLLPTVASLHVDGWKGINDRRLSTFFTNFCFHLCSFSPPQRQQLGSRNKENWGCCR